MEPKEETNRNKKPKHRFSVGRIRVAIWENGTGKDRWFNVEIDRRYEDNGEWKSTTRFGRDDLLFVAKAADMAFDLITKSQRQQAKTDERIDESETL